MEEDTPQALAVSSRSLSNELARRLFAKEGTEHKSAFACKTRLPPHKIKKGSRSSRRGGLQINLVNEILINSLLILYLNCFIPVVNIEFYSFSKCHLLSSIPTIRKN